jgi:hypothetical protein
MWGESDGTRKSLTFYIFWRRLHDFAIDFRPAHF